MSEDIAQPRIHPVPPSISVLRAFGVTALPARLPGGQGVTHRAGNMILKPTDRPEEIEWLASVLPDVVQNDFRLLRYVPSIGGNWVVDGWTAQEYMEGVHATDRWPDVIAVCERLHGALVGIPRPYFLDARTDPWSVADRVAWQEEPLRCFPELESPLHDLFAVWRPVHLPSQLIHGDVTLNVLFADGHPPGIIDFSSYWRPAEFAVAVVVVDALVWEGADVSIFDHVKHVREIDQMLVRAEIRRIMEIDGQHRQYGKNRLHDIEQHARAVDLICRRASGA